MTARRRHPARETAIIGRDNKGGAVFVCGIPVEPDATEPVSLRSRHHPGFGVVILTCNGRPVDYDGKGDGERTLQWYENRARALPYRRWEVVVNGPLSGYTLRRIRGQWYVTESNRGFA
jgi:hypothetical protein